MTGGSKESLTSNTKLALKLPKDSSNHNIASPPFKNGTQLSFKGEPLTSPLYQSDRNTNFQSQTSMPRNDQDNTN